MMQRLRCVTLSLSKGGRSRNGATTAEVERSQRDAAACAASATLRQAQGDTGVVTLGLLVELLLGCGAEVDCGAGFGAHVLVAAGLCVAFCGG